MPDELRQKYEQKKQDIEKRLADFKYSFLQDDMHVFAELCFCLLTPQTKAKSAWRVIEKLKESGLLYSGTSEEIKKWMASVRFSGNKSRYIVEARSLFSGSGGLKLKDKISAQPDIFSLRAWLVENVNGFGMKEASHFLRNVGYGENIAILDRHILKNLAKHGVIGEIPKSLTEKKYIDIEGKMRKFASETGIPMAHLDLLWWSEETGEIFK